MISSDWNECLAPCGPFDALAFAYPDLQPDMTTVFRSYTANTISLGEAAARIEAILPGPLTAAGMDAYLDSAFRTYRGVPDLIRWAAENGVLFMINTTGMIGYFQRVFSRGLLPAVTALAAHPLIRFDESAAEPAIVMDLVEIADKARHSEAVARRFSLPPSQVAVIGDSGGDGPHFAWAAANGAVRVGSMTKSSLDAFCRREKIAIDLRFGPAYGPGEVRDEDAEAGVDFRELIPFLERRLLGQPPCAE
jgi:hypothetical protein